MLAPEVIQTLKLHLLCIQRQHTPACSRNCDQCDACVRKNKTTEALETTIKVLEWFEVKRSQVKK